MVACSLAATLLDYCNALLYGAGERLKDKLQRAQNRLTRIVCDTGRDVYSHDLSRLHLLPVKEQIKYIVTSLTYFARVSGQPAYLASQLHDAGPAGHQNWNWTWNFCICCSNSLEHWQLCQFSGSFKDTAVFVWFVRGNIVTGRSKAWKLAIRCKIICRFGFGGYQADRCKGHVIFPKIQDGPPLHWTVWISSYRHGRKKMFGSKLWFLRSRNAMEHMLHPWHMKKVASIAPWTNFWKCTKNDYQIPIYPFSSKTKPFRAYKYITSEYQSIPKNSKKHSFNFRYGHLMTSS
jgi:hypothetical protein